MTTTVRHDVEIAFGDATDPDPLVLTGALVHDDENRALWLETDEGPEHLSTDLRSYGLHALPGHLYIKDWSEHSGLAERLAARGLVRIAGSVRVGPFASTAYDVVVL